MTRQDRGDIWSFPRGVSLRMIIWKRPARQDDQQQQQPGWREGHQDDIGDQGDRTEGLKGEKEENKGGGEEGEGKLLWTVGRAGTKGSIRGPCGPKNANTK